MEKFSLVCSLWLTARPLRGLQMSAPWTSQKGVFLVPKPWPLPQAMMLYMPLELWTWTTLLFTVLLFALMLHSTARLLPRGMGGQYLSLRLCLLDTFRILMLNSPHYFPQPITLRYLLTSWSFFCLLTTTIYLTGYTALLTSPIFSTPINTISDLLQQDIYWGEVAKGDFIFLFQDTGYPKLEEFGKRFVAETSESDRENRILKGHYAVFTKALSTAFVTDTEKLSDRARRSLRVMKEHVFKFYVAIGLQVNSPFKSRIDRTITQLQDAGITGYWQNRVIQNLGYHYMSTFFQLIHNENNQAPLSWNSVQGAFCLLGVGLSLSCIIWLMELSAGFYFH